MPGIDLRGAMVRLRTTGESDRAAIIAIRSTPEVWRRWGGDDLDAEFTKDLTEPGVERLTIERGRRPDHRPDPVRRERRPEVPPCRHRPVHRPGGPAAGARHRCHYHARCIPVRRVRAPPAGDRSGRRQRRGNRLLHERRIPTRRRDAAVRVAGRRLLGRRAADGTGRLRTLTRNGCDPHRLSPVLEHMDGTSPRVRERPRPPSAL